MKELNELKEFREADEIVLEGVFQVTADFVKEPNSHGSYGESPPHARRFEDLVAWQRARELGKFIFELTKQSDFARDYKFCSQTLDASRSIAANIAEGFERRSRSEFHQAVVTAKGSAGEVRSDLYIAFDRGYIGKEQLERALALSVEVSRLLEALRVQLDRQRQT